MKRNKLILFWVPYPTEGASNRYRIEQYLPFLSEEGFSFVLRPFWSSASYKILYQQGKWLSKIWYFLSGSLKRIWDSLTILRYDAVFIHREAYPLGGAIFERWINLLGRPVIFDFDDAIFLASVSKPNHFIDKLKNPRKTAYTIQHSGLVIAGNAYLADYAKAINSRTVIIPTPVNTDIYKPLPRNNKENFIIGWIGSSTTTDFLRQVSDPLSRICREFPHVRLMVVGNEAINLEGVNSIFKQWSISDELNDITQFDIGIMPMPDDPWTKGKCAFKAIIYMAMGLPCIASPVGMNKELIRDGINGLLAENAAEWTSKLRLLITDAQLRMRLSVAARTTVVEKYSLKANRLLFIKALKDTLRK